MKRRALTLLLAFAMGFALPAGAPAAEVLNLTTPVTAPSITTWKPVQIHLDRENQTIRVLFRGPAGEAKTCVEVGAAATTTMTALNKANLTSNSLGKRTITWAQGLGCLGAGTISGAAD